MARGGRTAAGYGGDMADQGPPVDTSEADPREVALVLGATGYVGGRLVPRLLDAGYRVRCLARTPAKLAGLAWGSDVEIVQGDLLDAGSLAGAFRGADVVYHLVHSMGSADEFAEADRKISRNIIRSAEQGGARRIIYLGGLGEIDENTSAHLRSRAEVAEILKDGPVPTTVLRAAVIIGSGSASFEMLRHLVEKLPVMITPRWVDSRVQPIAIRDVLRYLVDIAALDDDGADHDYDIGGPEVLTYLEMMQAYARVAELPRRIVLKVPVLSPSLSSHWVNLVTPVPVGIARPLVSSLTNEVVVRDTSEDITAVVPGSCLPYEQALRLALSRIRDADVETSWRDAELAGRSPAEPYPGDPEWTGGTLLRDYKELHVEAPPWAMFASVSRIGGQRGWPTHMWAWQIRGRLDRLIGGVGLRRGRRHPTDLRVGDALDFWRVEDVRRPSRDPGDPGEGVLRLIAEMRVPGRAWLEWRMAPAGDRAGTHVVQRALFAPKGLFGRLYWYALLPAHGFIFKSMLETLAADAVELSLTSSDAPTGPPEAPDAAVVGPSPAPPPARRAS
jgi:uncharacterized protein YbjT (DUF2867 family)